MKRAFIWGPLNFPHGSSSANYVQHFADALIDLGYHVVILSDANKGELQKEDNWINAHNGKAEIQDILIRKDNKWIRYIDNNFLFTLRVVKKFKKMEKNHQDIMISYTHDGILSLIMNRIAKKANMKTYACVVEMYPKEEYGHWLFSLKYWKEYINYKFAFPKYNCIFPISSFIKQYLDRNNINNRCIPCMANPFEYEYKEKIRTGKRVFIYPAMGKMKDSLSAILGSFNYLNAEEISHMEFHITGVKEEKVREYISDWDTVKKSVVIHKWMEYDELISLYGKCDYMLLAREVNQMTKANFPSKVPEVMCFGVVPIVSKVGDYTRYYLHDKENSLVVEGCSAQLFAEAIRTAVYMPESELERLSVAARKCAEERFCNKNWEKTMKLVIEENK